MPEQRDADAGASSSVPPHPTHESIPIGDHSDQPVRPRAAAELETQVGVYRSLQNLLLAMAHALAAMLGRPRPTTTEDERAANLLANERPPLTLTARAALPSTQHAQVRVVANRSVTDCASVATSAALAREQRAASVTWPTARRPDDCEPVPNSSPSMKRNRIRRITMHSPEEFAAYMEAEAQVRLMLSSSTRTESMNSSSSGSSLQPSPGQRDPAARQRHAQGDLATAP